MHGKNRRENALGANGLDAKQRHILQAHFNTTSNVSTSPKYDFVLTSVVPRRARHDGCDTPRHMERAQELKGRSGHTETQLIAWLGVFAAKWLERFFCLGASVFAAEMAPTALTTRLAHSKQKSTLEVACSAFERGLLCVTVRGALQYCTIELQSVGPRYALGITCARLA